MRQTNEAHASRLFCIGFVFHVVNEETEPKGLHGDLFKVVGVEREAWGRKRTSLIPSSLVYKQRKTSQKPLASQHCPSPSLKILSVRLGIHVDGSERLSGRPGPDLIVPPCQRLADGHSGTRYVLNEVIQGKLQSGMVMRGMRLAIDARTLRRMGLYVCLANA